MALIDAACKFAAADPLDALLISAALLLALLGLVRAWWRRMGRASW
jgi:hypothetical protein